MLRCEVPKIDSVEISGLESKSGSLVLDITDENGFHHRFFVDDEGLRALWSGLASAADEQSLQ